MEVKVDRTRIVAAVYRVIDELNEQLTEGPRIEKSGSTPLFGKNSVLDSLGLVHLIVGLEQGINEEFGANISLATEKAMSRERSPFRTIDSLVDFVAELLEGT